LAIPKPGNSEAKQTGYILKIGNIEAKQTWLFKKSHKQSNTNLVISKLANSEA
jgi:hypothetical protein